MSFHHVSSDTAAALNWFNEHHRRILSDEHWLFEIWKTVSDCRKVALSRQSGEHRNGLRHLNNFTDFNFAEIWITQPVNGQSVIALTLAMPSAAAIMRKC